MIRYIVHNKKFLTTPKILKEALNAQYRISHFRLSEINVTADYNLDFLMYFPNEISNKPENYDMLRWFSRAAKGVQRKYLDDYTDFSTPNTFPAYMNKYVVRPHYHYGGQEFRIVNRISDYDQTSEYISPLFPKKWEYRLIYYKGIQVCTLYKRNSQGLPIEEPWNHDNGSSFITVNHYPNDRIRNTNFYTVFENELYHNSFFKLPHLLGIDIMIDKDYNYCITEMNFSPAFTIESNIEKLKVVMSNA